MFKTPAEAVAFAKNEGVEYIDVRFTDLPGRWQHFSIPAHALDEDVFSEGLGFDGSSIQGFQSIEASDMLLLLDPSSAFVDPYMQHKTLVMVADVKDPISGELYGKDPRGVAKRAEAYLRETGVADTCYMGPEAEFFVFDAVSFNDDPYSYGYRIIAEETHTDGDELGDGYWIRPKMGYFPVPPSDKSQDLRAAMVGTLEAAGIEIELHHHEVATSQHEIDMRFDTLTRVADKLMTYKYIVKNTAAQLGKTATFMPKPIYGDNGSGMHCHQSLWSGGDPLFYDASGYAGLSKMAMHYVAGLLAHGPALEDKPEYPFQNIRTKNYFWGDGDKVRSFGLNEAVNSPCQSEVLTPHADPLLEPQGQLPQEGVKKDAFLKHEKDAPVIFGSRKADHASPANETAAVCRKPIYLLCRNMQTPPVQKDC